MATLIQAISTYRPRVAKGRTIELDALAQHLSVGTLVTAPIARMVLDEVGRQVLLHLQAGDKVRLPGIGLLCAEVRLNGDVYPTIRLDPALRGGLSEPGAFRGTVTNPDMVGAPLDAFRKRCNAAHPEDPVVLPPGVVRVA